MPTLSREITLIPLKISNKLPKLRLGINFHFTSDPTDDYNCAAWATEIDDIWIQFHKDKLDITGIARYIEYYQSYGFEMTQNPNFEDGVVKIAIYTKIEEETGDVKFMHVSRQLPNGHWTSKLGLWEDIEHYNLDVLAGDFYGEPTHFLSKALS